MYLPNPPATYNSSVLAAAFQRINQALQSAFKQGEDVIITRTFDTSGIAEKETRLILQAPNGSHYKVVVDNAGNLSTTAVPLSEL